MPLSLDREIEFALKSAAISQVEAPPPLPGDAIGLRAQLHPIMEAVEAQSSRAPDVSVARYQTVAPDGAEIDLHWYTRANDRPGSAVVYLHGGGMIAGKVAFNDSVIARYVSETGVPILAVAYRLAPEHPHPVPVEDCNAGLEWLLAHTEELGVDRNRIAVMGDSAGGGLAAGVALFARDRGTKLARQILLYPMLDDRNLEPDPELAPFAVWNYDNNLTGWSALLSGLHGTEDVPQSAAPARAANLANLAPAYIEVGDLDIFRSEDIDYARRLAEAGVTIELHVHPGAPHAFERLAPDSDVAKRAMADRMRVLSCL